MNDWSALTTPDIQAFITAHQNTDVRDLALKKPPHADWPYALILDQIKSRQKARSKIPHWLEHDAIIFPSADTLEQGSSAATAAYKASLVTGDTFTDLTGGAGIDSAAFAQHFTSGTVIDRDENTAQRLTHNLAAFGHSHVKTAHSTAEEFVQNMQPTDCVIIDPQRRNQSRKGLYRLQDCSPNIIDLLPALMDKAQTTILKTSPMLDIDLGITALRHDNIAHVSAVHIVEYQSECKEILFIIKPQHNAAPQDIPITAVTIDDNGKAIKSITFTRAQESTAQCSIAAPLNYLYEPSAAFMKAGCFKTLAQHFGAQKLHPHTHLYTSDDHIAGFPGRCFTIKGTFPVQAKALPTQKANLAIRNFPMDIAALKKKLKIKDGGDEYYFACTIQPQDGDDQHRVVWGRRIEEVSS